MRSSWPLSTIAVLAVAAFAVTQLGHDEDRSAQARRHGPRSASFALHAQPSGLDALRRARALKVRMRLPRSGRWTLRAELLDAPGARPLVLGPPVAVRRDGREPQTVRFALAASARAQLPSCAHAHLRVAARRDGGATLRSAPLRLANGRACRALDAVRGWHATADPPIDPRQGELTFGNRSHWLQPWRSYLETRPASALRDGVGINFNVTPAEADATARRLADAGVRRARVELSWGTMRYDQPDQLMQQQLDGIRAQLTALRHHGIRPLILLNSNAGGPCPSLPFTARLLAPARRGARTLLVDPATAAQIVPGRSGIDQPGKLAGVLFERVAGGVVTLAAPLSAGLAAGTHAAHALRYPPFAPAKLADGRANPAFDVTYDGWIAYVGGALRLARETLGSTRFDVEIWNELSFGSQFLDRGTYDGRPPPARGLGAEPELLARTVAWLRDPANGFADVPVTDGFASQRPWDAAAIVPAGLTAISKHPYHGAVRFPDEALINTIVPLDARGRTDSAEQTLADGTKGARDRFIPRYRTFFPEYFLTAIQTETLVRDLSPRTSEIFGVPHGRHAAPDGGAPVAVWLTELGMDPSGLDPSTPRRGTAAPGPLTYREVLHLQAKAALRSYVAFLGKGAGAVYLYAASGFPFGLVTSDGTALRAIGRLTRAFAGPADAGPPRPLTLQQVADDGRGVQFDGDGTDAHPPLHDRDVLLVQPFQRDAHSWVVPTYVMTRDIARLYRPRARSGDVTRYDLPEEPFRLRIGGLDGRRATAALSDPLSGRARPLQSSPAAATRSRWS